MDSPETAEHPLAPMEAPPDPSSEVDAPWFGLGSCMEIGQQWSWPLVELRGLPHEPGLPPEIL